MEQEASQETPKFYVSQIINHKYFGKGRVLGIDGPFYVVQFSNEVKKIPTNYREMEALELTTDPELERIKQAVAEVLGDYGWIETELELAKRWVGGTVRLIPGAEGTQSKDIPLEGFFKKIIGIREKLRVLEQKINNHPKLDPADKLDLQAYLTRCYGSLTTFNSLFANKSSHFKGSGGAGEDA